MSNNQIIAVSLYTFQLKIAIPTKSSQKSMTSSSSPLATTSAEISKSSWKSVASMCRLYSIRLGCRAAKPTNKCNAIVPRPITWHVHRTIYVGSRRQHTIIWHTRLCNREGRHSVRDLFTQCSFPFHRANVCVTIWRVAGSPTCECRGVAPTPKGMKAPRFGVALYQCAWPSRINLI